jgi:anti-sigma regulatory factor (Ser/Thr protein kinase)
LGVFLVRQMMDAVSYRRVGARNRLSMTKHIAR